MYERRCYGVFTLDTVFLQDRPYGPHLTSCARTLRPTRAITPTLCAQKAPGLHAQLPQFFMYVKHARPTCTIAPIFDVGEKCPAYMQAAPEPPFCILLFFPCNLKEHYYVQSVFNFQNHLPIHNQLLHLSG